MIFCGKRFLETGHNERSIYAWGSALLINNILFSEGGGEYMGLRVLACCGLGIGSSIILKTNALKIFQELGVDFNLEVADMTTAKSIPFDLAITNVELSETLRNSVPENQKDKIISISNFIDKKEMKRKIEEFLREHGR